MGQPHESPRSGPPKRGWLSAEWLLSAPSMLWLLVFFAIPTLLVFAMAFKPSDPYGGLGPGWTLDSLTGMQWQLYVPLAWRTLWLSALATVICVLLAIPCAYAMARAPKSWRSLLLLLIIIPFWTSFLIRIFAWKVLLHPEGFLKQGLVALGVIGAEVSLLNRMEAVLLVIIYTSLPFAILPIYAAAEKFDFTLLEAARDLGANRWRAMVSVFLPGISRGIGTAILLVLIPNLGNFVVPAVVGGPGDRMLGNMIAQRVLSDRNLPQASILSACLVLAVLLPLAVAVWLNRRRDRSLAAPRPGARP